MAIRYCQLTSEQKQVIINAFRNGIECREIPKQLGVSERSVARVLLEAGINTKRRNRYILNENYFDSIDSPVKAYLLGLLAADGCVTQANYIAFESIDRELVECLKSELCYSGDIREIYFAKHAPHYRINFSSKNMAIALAEKGVMTGRVFSDTVYFPKLEYLAPYVLGWFDGDGCAYANRGRSGGLICIVGSFSFANELVKYLKMGVVTQHCRKRVYYWRIYSRSNIRAFYELVYQHPNLGLSRKKQKIEQILGGYRRG